MTSDEIRLRYIADINPSVPEFDALAPDDEVTFVPLEAVWPNGRLDLGRTRPKADVATGYVRFREGDVLVPKVTPTFQAGRSALATGVPTNVGAASTEVHVARTRAGNDPRFVMYTFLSAPFLLEGVSAFQGVAGLQRVPDMFLRDFRVANLSLDEQRRISDFLDIQVACIAEAVRLRHEQVEALGVRRHLALYQCVSGTELGMAMNRHALLGEVPRDWEVTAVKRVVRRVGVGLVINPSSYVAPEGVPFLLGRNVRDGWFDLTDLNRMSPENSLRLPSSRLRSGDVVVVRAGYPGRAAVVTDELDGANCASILILRQPTLVLPEFLAAYFNSPQGRSQVRLAQYGAAQEQINVGDVVDFQIPVPPRDTQRYLVDRQQALDHSLGEAIAEMRAQVELLHVRQRSLITAALTGEFDIPTASGRGV